MADINLLSPDSGSQSSVNNGVLSRVVARLLLILVIVAAAIYVMLFVVNYTTNRTEAADQKQVQTLQAQALANKDRNELVTRQEQLTQLNTLLDNHEYWSYLMPELARVTLKSARYSEIMADSKGKLQLSVILPSYAEVEKFMEIFDLPEYNQQFSNVRIVGIENVQTGSSIEIKLRLELTFNSSYIKGRM